MAEEKTRKTLVQVEWDNSQPVFDNATDITMTPSNSKSVSNKSEKGNDTVKSDKAIILVSEYSGAKEVVQLKVLMHQMIVLLQLI